MSSNRGVVYLGPGSKSRKSIIRRWSTRAAARSAGVILKVVSTNICGSDQHMVRGRTTAPVGLVLGHEITGEVVEIGRDVETLKLGDLVSVPFNVACGRCAMQGHAYGRVPEREPSRAGGAYGYVDMGGWIGGRPSTCSCRMPISTC